MRRNRLPLLLAALCSLVFAATSALACGGSNTKVSGTFDKYGHFVVASAWMANGMAIPNSKGVVVTTFTTVDNLVLPAASLKGKQVCLIGDLDILNNSMEVTSYQECAGACGAKGASAKGASAATASAGAGGCCAAKGASAATASAGAGGCCAAKGASAATASAGAGSCCAAKGASAAAAGAGQCPAMAAAAAGHCPAMAGAGAAGHCTAETKTAGAGAPTCCMGGAKNTVTTGASAKAASATTDNAAVNVNAVVYRVTGMHCEDCASKVRGAVTSLSLPNVTGCTVSVEKGQAVVTTKGDVDQQAIQKAITGAGFPAEIAKEDAAKDAATKS